MEEDKTTEECPTFPPTEPDYDINVPLDMEETSVSSLYQEDTTTPDIISSSSSEQELQSLPSSSKTDSETGENLKENFRSIWCLPRIELTTTSLSSDGSSEVTDDLIAEKETPVSKGGFEIPPEVTSDARPKIEVSEEKVEGVDENIVKDPAELMVTISAPTRTELNCWKFSKNLSSRTISTSEDTLPDHGVYVSEESSSSSLDVSQNISSMKLTESVDSGLKLPLVESPPPPPPSKRKISDPDLFIEDCSGNPSKKVRILPEEVSSESNQMTDEELQEKNVASACSEGVGTETDKGPLIEFPEEAEGCSKSERGSTKRTVMAEDVTDVSAGVKRIKPSD